MNDNYMKTILSGVKEWTENLTDDAVDKANKSIDKANNALDKANNALDKALFVVNITSTDGVTLSADKTFEEIVQAYNEGKYNIVANISGVYLMPLLAILNYTATFSCAIDLGEHQGIISFSITNNNEVLQEIIPLATETSKLPNPYPLKFTGAVNETYDGSSAKTIEIPSGGGGAAASGLCIYDNYDVTLISFAQIDQATLPIDAGIEITTDDNGNPFSYDGLVVWSDIKSGASYTDIDFNNVKNCHYPIQHGVKDSMNMYIVDGTSMQAIVGSKSCVYIRQTRDDVNAAFYPAPNIEQLPEKFTAIHLCPRNKVVSGTFYKIWGLTKK